MAAVNVDPGVNEKVQIDHGRSDPASREEDVEKHALSLRGSTLTAALAFVAGTGFTLFGYASDWNDESVSLRLLLGYLLDMTKALCRHC